MFLSSRGRNRPACARKRKVPATKPVSHPLTTCIVVPVHPWLQVQLVGADPRLGGAGGLAHSAAAGLPPWLQELVAGCKLHEVRCCVPFDAVVFWREGPVRGLSCLRGGASNPHVSCIHFEIMVCLAAAPESGTRLIELFWDRPAYTQGWPCYSLPCCSATAAVPCPPILDAQVHDFSKFLFGCAGLLPDMVRRKKLRYLVQNPLLLRPLLRLQSCNHHKQAA